MTDENRICAGTRSNGGSCHNPARPGSLYCAHHDPDPAVTAGSPRWREAADQLEARRRAEAERRAEFTDTCSRCGRRLTAFENLSDWEAFGDGGALVCPQCVTSNEQQAADEDVMDMIDESEAND